MDITFQPRLERVSVGGLHWWTDPQLETEGVVIAFSERSGGASDAPFDSLNLAAHVGDEARCVDENRARWLEALGLAHQRTLLTVAEQVHGTAIVDVDESIGGSGAFACGPKPPVSGTDALTTREAGIPLLMCFADCVPIVLVAPGPAVAVVHAGWRGALGELPGAAAIELAQAADCGVDRIVAYVGPHIGSCHYPVSEDVLSQFVNTFGTFARAESGGLDLGAVVTTDLARSGVPRCRIAELRACTAEQTDRFYSYRAEGGLTGRHGALACVRL